MTIDAATTVPNLRDLGGLPVGAGRTRRHILYRSAVPLAEDVPPPAVPVWPPRTVIDLRSPSELATRPHPLTSEHTSVHTISLMSDEQVSRPYTGRDIGELYREILAGAGPQLAEIVRVAATAPAPILLHCAAGKDRTGIAVALLLRVAGVSNQDVVSDYLSTNDHLTAVLRRLGKDTAPAGADHPSDRDRRGAVREAIEAVLDQWDSHAGGVVGWLTGHGLDAAVPAAWTARFTGR
ncbi:tyrosine-protein phosphatase [Nocardia farcinica]|uniref:tyrosine-protein phosphatase n=1 Tax=Nocardia farcinica TaxID=37329 RepID=UPI000A3755D3|nr:tyrosine-protein phosphatase [Nocardia farcinica]MBA4857522.1 tyrosine-protein phosphatase [Nocardia farcinica]MBC9816179.1 tyrosine-protein phosphatase [Nocardia farcinica]MBF6072410.1 tyrosine-protein phosphatase [Nocardia farcinica]MBF6262418.1 tyrosine-protein phosphatase [Nocardia farcinica]MBF6280958.1 tyrosine-protein phosphatase [Nocardia farcinica]